MPGLWITRLAQRLTRPDTFDRLVSPAIADLQFESQRTRMARWRHYPAIVAIIARALLQDFHREVTVAFDADAWRVVWARAAVWALAAAAVNWAVVSGLTSNLLNRSQTPDALRQTIFDGVIFQSVGPALTVAMIVAAYNLKRRDGTRMGTLVAATAVVAVTAFVATYVSTMLQVPARQALDEAGRALHGSDITVIRSPMLWQLTMNAVTMIPFAWLGVVLARRRGWPLALSAGVILGTWQLLNQTAFRLYWPLAQLVPGVQAVLFGPYSVPMNIVTLVALIFLWRAIERRVDPPSALTQPG